MASSGILGESAATASTPEEALEHFGEINLVALLPIIDAVNVSVLDRETNRVVNYGILLWLQRAPTLLLRLLKWRHYFIGSLGSHATHIDSGPWPIRHRTGA